MNAVFRAARIVLAIPLLVAACDDNNSTEPDGELPSGSLEFSYDGDATGFFSARGAPAVGQGGQQLEYGTFAAAVRDNIAGEEVVLLFAVQAGQEPIADIVAFVIDGSEEGSWSFDIADCEGGTAACGFGEIAFEVDTSTGDGPADEDYFGIEAGTLTIASTTGGVIQGSFSGTAVARDPDTSDELRTISLTEGDFSLTVLTEEQLNLVGNLSPSASRAYQVIRQRLEVGG